MRGVPGRSQWLGAVGAALLLVYALPVFFPPPAVAPANVPPGAPFLAQLFPQVPAWWITIRLLALVAGAGLVAATVRTPVFHLSVAPTPRAGREWRWHWIPLLALLAAAAQLLSLRWRATFSPLGQTLFMGWFGVPAALLAWGAKSDRAPRARRAALIACWPVGLVVVGWLLVRTVVSWHSPRAADVVDMWRVFGGFVQLVGSGGNFLTGTLDPELPGLTAILLFFQGFPLLQLTSQLPDLTWVQATNAIALAACAVTIAALAAMLVSRSVAVVAAAAFLFAPFTLVSQLSPMPAIQLLVPALAALLLARIYRAPSPAALALLGSVVGISAGMPPLVAMTGLAALLAAWHVWRRREVSRLVIATAALSLLTGMLASLPNPGAIAAMFARYAATQIPLAVAERAVDGQLSPTIEDWLGGPLPADIPLERLAEYRIPVTRPPLLVPIGALLAPFAIPRWPLRLWGDALFDPLGAGLAAIGLAVCLRHARRDRTSLAVLLFLLAALLPGFVSSYDRASVLRLFGAPVPMALLAAAGLHALLRPITGEAVRRWTAVAVAIGVGAGGMVVFDVVNPRILAASSVGLLVRSVAAPDFDRAALLTSYGRDSRPDVPPGRRYWELDWLRHHHPYLQEIVRCVPDRPIPLTALDRLGEWDTDHPEYPLVFWSPALEQAAGVTAQLCRRWPEATLYTVVDAAGLSRLNAARLAGTDWSPAVPCAQWTTRRCPQGLSHRRDRQSRAVG